MTAALDDRPEDTGTAAPDAADAAEETAELDATADEAAAELNTDDGALEIEAGALEKADEGATEKTEEFETLVFVICLAKSLA